VSDEWVRDCNSCTVQTFGFPLFCDDQSLFRPTSTKKSRNEAIFLAVISTLLASFSCSTYLLFFFFNSSTRFFFLKPTEGCPLFCSSALKLWVKKSTSSFRFHRNLPLESCTKPSSVFFGSKLLTLRARTHQASSYTPSARCRSTATRRGSG
jgi:hypothetical protein